MNTEASKKQFLKEYDLQVAIDARNLGFKDLMTISNGFYQTIYDKVNFRMIEMFSSQNNNHQEFDVEDVSLETEYTYVWKSIYIPNCSLELALTTEQYLDLLQSSVTKSNQLFLAYLDKTIEFKIEKQPKNTSVLSILMESFEQLIEGKYVHSIVHSNEGFELEVYDNKEDLEQTSGFTKQPLLRLKLTHINGFSQSQEYEQEDCCSAMVNEPTKLEYYLNLIERIASMNHCNGTNLRTQELEEEINTIIKQREF